MTRNNLSFQPIFRITRCICPYHPCPYHWRTFHISRPKKYLRAIIQSLVI